MKQDTHFVNWIGSGGIGRYLHHLVAGFGETCVTIDGPFVGALGAARPADLRVVRLPWFRPARVRERLRAQLTAWDCRLTHPAIIHLAQYPCPGWIAGAKRRGARVVYTVYDLIPELFINPGQLLEERRAALAVADQVIAISQSTAADLHRLYSIPTERITVVPLATHLAAQPATHAGRPYFLCVGNRAGYKNFPAALGALGLIAATQLEVDLVCAGPPLAEWEMREIAAQGLGARVLCRPRPSDAQLTQAYAGATACIVPSLYEGFGLPVLEAMACGTPVISARAGSLAEVGGDAVLYAEPNAPAIASAMLRILQEPALAGELRRAGYARAGQFSWAQTARETELVYRRLAS
jgi:glycosyltransferase involved in cell wall biosynthesis